MNPQPPSQPEVCAVPDPQIVPKAGPTPPSRGTTSQAFGKVDGRAGAEVNMTLVQEDLSTTATIAWRQMIVMWLKLKATREDGNSGLNLANLDEKGDDYAEAQLSVLITKAVDFCNKSRSDTLKKELKAAVTTKGEKGRYPFLAAAFNSVLEHFSGKDIEGLEALPESNGLVFCTNDPNIIRSGPISSQSDRVTVRKPDLIATDTSTLLWLAPDGQEKYSSWPWSLPTLNTIVKGSRNKLAWYHCHSAIEVKVKKTHTAEDVAILFEECDIDTFLADGSQVVDNEEDKDGENDDVVGDEDASGSAVNQPPLVQSYASYSIDQSLPEKSTVHSTSTLLKRKAMTPPPSELGSNASKKARMDSLKPLLKLDLKTQCAYYGIEMLKSSPDRTHSIVLQVVDSNLTLIWYDAQGCIRSSPIDMVAQLPLLVVTLVLLQRFKDRMRGRGHFNFAATLEDTPVEFEFHYDTPCRWEMKGRRPVAAVPVPKGYANVTGAPKPGESDNDSVSRVLFPNNIVTPSNAWQEQLLDTSRNTSRPYTSLDPSVKEKFKVLNNYWLKLSWPEASRVPEPDIIAEAKKRAIRYLPKDHTGDVIDHLPTIVTSGNAPEFSTGLTRRLAGIPSEEEKGRIPTWILSERLLSFNEVETKYFVARFWQIIRCHKLLWRVGIAHGDVSFFNIMLSIDRKRAILIDFDLAAVMKPGATSPSQSGFERTGTMPFMAIDVLTSWDGPGPLRVYPHDLEAIIWCIVWYFHERYDWAIGSMEEVCSKKHQWVRRVLPGWGVGPLPRGIRAGIEGRHLESIRRILFKWQNLLNDQCGGCLEVDDKVTNELFETGEPDIDSTYMNVIFKWLPHGKDLYAWDWKTFAVPVDSIPK